MRTNLRYVTHFKYEACAFKADGDGEIKAAAAASSHFAAKGQVHAGIVVIKVIAGHNLVNMDQSWFGDLSACGCFGMGGIDGVSDPFVVITGRDGKSAKTKTVPNDLNPRWGETLMLNVDDPTVPLQLSVFDHDDLTADDQMGDAKVVDWWGDWSEDAQPRWEISLPEIAKNSTNLPGQEFLPRISVERDSAVPPA